MIASISLTSPTGNGNHLIQLKNLSRSKSVCGSETLILEECATLLLYNEENEYYCYTHMKQNGN
jgi:hypothetical protein